MNEKARPGSMLEAEQKEWGISKIVMAAVTVILFSLSYFNLFGTFFYIWQHRASQGAQTFGIVFYVLSLLPLVIEPWLSSKTKNESLWFILWFIGIGLGIVVSAGFNFAL